MLIKFQRFFNATKIGLEFAKPDFNLITLISNGLVPRIFSSSNNDDKHIYQENMEVEEMYFILEGKIGIGFQLPTFDQNRMTSI